MTVKQSIICAMLAFASAVLKGCGGGGGGGGGGSGSTTTATTTISTTTTATTMTVTPAVPMPYDDMDVHFRPPLQTSEQHAVLKQLTASAHDDSQNAKDWVLSQLEGAKPAFGGTKLEGLKSQELLDILDWEFAHLPIWHNAPFDVADDLGDDDRMPGALSNGFLANVCQRWVLRGGHDPDCGYCDGMQDNFHVNVSSWENPHDPTVPEANNCILFMANNWLKTECGLNTYGTVSYVFNHQRFGDLFGITPCDSGWCHPPPAWGTLKDFYHLLEPNLGFLQIDLASVMKRWTVPGTPEPTITVHPQHYMEIELYGSFKLPEVLSYIVADFSGTTYGPSGKLGVAMWGTDNGLRLQKWMAAHGRPLIWTSCDGSGMLLDPVVGIAHKQHFQQSDIDYFKSHWQQSTDFHEFFAGASKALQFRYLSYFEKDKCAHAEEDANNIILGIDGNDNCVYWPWVETATDWECLNDGTCGKVDPKFASVPSGVLYATEEDCLKNCGSGRWECVKRSVTGRVFNAKDNTYVTNYCEPNATGSCADKNSCEQSCTNSQVQDEIWT